jgi:hypothetical protein
MEQLLKFGFIIVRDQKDQAQQVQSYQNVNQML